jgi:hypothetical protein
VGLRVEKFDTRLADVNCKNGVTIIDALLITRLYVGLISEFICGTPAPTQTPEPVFTPEPIVGLVYISPETQSVYSGSHFTTGINIHTIGWFYAYLEFVIHYDDTVLAIDHAAGEEGIEVDFGLPIAEMENSNGILEDKSGRPAEYHLRG